MDHYGFDAAEPATEYFRVHAAEPATEYFRVHAADYRDASEFVTEVQIPVG